MAKDRQPLDPWTRRPEEMTAEDRVQLVRAPTRGSLNMIVLSHDLIGRATHHYGGRTSPCMPGCRACEDGQLQRWLGWIAVAIHPSLQVALYETTAPNAQLLDEAFKEHRTMKGLKISVYRPSGKSNGRVVMKVHGLEKEKLLLPEAPNVKRVLYKIWQLREEDDKPFTPGPRTNESQAQRDEVNHALNRSVGKEPANGLQRARGLGTPHDLHQQPEEDRSIRQSATTDASHASPSQDEKQNANGSGSVEHISASVARLLGNCLPAGELKSNGL